MINKIQNLPSHVAGFRASGEVTEADFKNVVEPEVKRLVEKTGELNYLLVLDTEIGNFTVGAWLRDALLGINNLIKWNRAAIVTDSDTIIKFTDGFSYLAPGEYKGFPKADYDQAVAWVAAV